MHFSKQQISVFFAFLLLILLGIAGYHYAFSKPDFTTLDNQDYTHKSLQKKILVVNYFAQWCAPCLKEIPELNRFNQDKPDDVQILAISYDNLSTEQLQGLRDKYAIDYPIVDKIYTPFAFERPSYLPATFIINAKAERMETIYGELTAKQLSEVIAKTR